MYTYHTKQFSYSLVEGIAEWLNTFSDHHVEVVSMLPNQQTTGNVSGLHDILVTIRTKPKVDT